MNCTIDKTTIIRKRYEIILVNPIVYKNIKAETNTVLVRYLNQCHHTLDPLGCSSVGVKVFSVKPVMEEMLIALML